MEIGKLIPIERFAAESALEIVGLPLDAQLDALSAAVAATTERLLDICPELTRAEAHAASLELAHRVLLVARRSARAQ
jgi:hypothetical protein